MWRRRPPRSATVAVATLIALIATLPSLAPARGAGETAGAAFGSTQGGTQVPHGPVPCSGLVNSTILTDLVSLYYPNGSLLPTQSQAVAAVTSSWGSVCNSTGFQGALSAAAGGWFEYSSRMQDKNRTSSGQLVGSLFVSFQLTWNSSCPTGGPGYPVGYRCQYSDVWQANLTDNSVRGPATSVTSLRFVPCQTPGANETAVSSVEGFFPDPGVAPNESVAVQEVQAIWGSICTSAGYYSIASSLDLPSSLGFSTWRAGTGPNGTLSPTGHLYFEWMLFTGDSPCPSSNGTGSNGQECSNWAGWTADLTADTFSGPTISNEPDIGGPPGAPKGNAGATPTVSTIPTLLGFGLLGAVVAAAVTVRVVDRGRR